MPVHLKFYLSDGQQVDIEDFEAQSVLDLRTRLDESPFIQFEIDDTITLVSRDHIVRLDIEEGPAP